MILTSNFDFFTFVEIGCFHSQFSANVAVKAVKAKASVIQLICKQNIRTFFIRAGAVISLERLEQNNWFGSQKKKSSDPTIGNWDQLLEVVRKSESLGPH